MISNPVQYFITFHKLFELRAIHLNMSVCHIIISNQKRMFIFCDQCEINKKQYRDFVVKPKMLLIIISLTELKYFYHKIIIQLLVYQLRKFIKLDLLIIYFNIY